MSQPHRRRKYLINKKYQLRWTGALLLVGLGAAAIGALVTAFAWVFIVGRGYSAQTESLVAYTAIWGVLTAASLVWLGVRITHRTAGPMYRFHQALKELAGGNTSVRIYLRKGDFWHEIADAFNDALDNLTSSGDKAETPDVGEALVAARAAAERYPDDDDLKKTVELLKRFADSE